MSNKPLSRHGNTKLLIGFAEALSAPEVVWSLVNSGFDVVVFSRRGSKTPLRRRRDIKIVEVCPPEHNVTQTLRDMGVVLKDMGLNMLMPLDDRAIWICSRLSALENIRNAGPTGFQADLALDKSLQIEAATRAGLRIIPTSIVDNIDDLFEIKMFPVLIKPAMATVEIEEKLISGPHYTCANTSELMCVARTWQGAYTLLAQSVISGIGEGLFGLATDHGIEAWSAHQRIRMMNPLGSGSSACRSLRISEQPLDLLSQMLSEIKWQGIFMVEMIRDHNDQLWFMEMNGRTWGSMALARRRGYEYPAWSILYALDSQFHPNIPEGFEDIVCRHLGREIMHFLTVLKGPQPSAVTPWPSILKTLTEVLTIEHNHAWYNLNKGDRLFFLEDAFRTVFDIFKKKIGFD